MAIKISLTGFEELLKKIEKANGNIEQASMRCIKESADIMQTELKSAMISTGISADLVNRMPNYRLENSGARVTARVGYPETSYNPKNPSDYHKAIFANYGTPHRKKYGEEKARRFIVRAKRAARKKIKAQQERTLNDILKDLT